jgi:hypothetical protein
LTQIKLRKTIVIKLCLSSEGFALWPQVVELQVPIISSGKAALKEVVSGKYILMETFNCEEFINLSKSKNGEYE